MDYFCYYFITFFYYYLNFVIDLSFVSNLKYYTIRYQKFFTPNIIILSENQKNKEWTSIIIILPVYIKFILLSDVFARS